MKMTIGFNNESDAPQSPDAAPLQTLFLGELRDGISSAQHKVVLVLLCLAYRASFFATLFFP